MDVPHLVTSFTDREGIHLFESHSDLEVTTPPTSDDCLNITD